MNLKHLFFLAVSLTLVVSACKKREIIDEPDPVYGCTDSLSLNFNPDATHDDMSCEYPEVFQPMKNGNEWHLKTVYNFFGTDYDILVDIVMDGDTVMNEMEYVLVTETFTAGSFGEQTTRYAYRTVHTGEVYRIDLSQTDLIESKFLTWPLDNGTKWFDTEAEDNLECQVVANAQITVPAGTFSNTRQIEYTDLENGQSTNIFFAKDVGVAKVEVEIDMSAFGFGIIQLSPELETYTLK